MATDITTYEEFESVVLGASLPVLVDFWGPQCAPCLAMMPFVEELSSRMESKLRLVKVNAPDARQICRQLRVLGLPTYILFHNGVEVRRIGGNDITERDILALAEAVGEIATD